MAVASGTQVLKHEIYGNKTRPELKMGLNIVPMFFFFFSNNLGFLGIQAAVFIP